MDGSVSGVLPKPSAARVGVTGGDGSGRGAVRERSRSTRGEGGEEPLAARGRTAAASVVQLEHGGHEVVLARALLEAADQVGDRDVELAPGARPACRAGVRRRRAGPPRPGPAPCRAASRSRRRRCTFRCCAGEQPGEGDVEQVVPGDADAHVRDALGVQGVVEQRACSWCRCPAWLCQVASGQPCTAASTRSIGRFAPLTSRTLIAAPPPCAPRRLAHSCKPHHRAERVGQVGLQHDAGFAGRGTRAWSSSRVNTAIVRSRSLYSSMSRLMNLSGRRVGRACETAASTT